MDDSAEGSGSAEATGPFDAGSAEGTGVGLRESLERLRASREGLLETPVAKLIDVLGGVGERFGDPSDPLRVEALRQMEEEAALSPAMAELVLDGMAVDWARGRLRRLVDEEMRAARSLDGFTSVDGRLLRAIGPELCVQIVAGSVPGVGVTALIRSLLVKAPTLLKPGHGDRALPHLFARGLRDADPGLARALAVEYWPGGSVDIEDPILAAASIVVVYGSDETVASVRGRTPPTTRVIAYHHRVSVAVVGREALSDGLAVASAADVARAAVTFEQRGCVCPRVTYVESGGEVDPRTFAALVAQQMKSLASELPGLAPGPSEGSAIQQFRGAAELVAADGPGEVFTGAGGPWTVVFEPTTALQRIGGGAGRLVRVRPIADAAELEGILRPVRRNVQTVGLTGLGDRASTLAERLVRVGVTRIVPVERMSFPPAWWLHDGRGPLEELVEWAEQEPGETGSEET